MKHFEKIIPQGVKKAVRKSKTTALRFLRKEASHSHHLRESTKFSDIGEAGPLITEIFEPLKDIPGWFNVDDCAHFYLTLSLQSILGVKGDLLEIGSYHGRSTAVMSKCLGPGERIVICDVFDLDAGDRYANKPSPETLLANIKRLNGRLEDDRIIIHKCISNDLRLDERENFRFIHIDGGHSAEQAYFDLEFCGKHVMPNGIIVMDDYHNRNVPGVTEGTDKFLKVHDDFRVLADLNRHGAFGRKLYLIKNKEPSDREDGP